MSKLSKEQKRAILEEYNVKTADDINTALKDMFGELLQEALEAELDTELSYPKNGNGPDGGTNRRNGHSKKTVRSDRGEIELLVPRDREGEFDPVIVKKHQKEVTGIEEQILALYAKGVSVRDIQAHLKQLYGVNVSPTLISNVTNRIMPVIRDWQSRPLQRVYAVVFLDAIHCKVKQEGHIVNKAVYMIIGIDLDGCKDVLGMYIGEHETSKFWLTVLNELRNRGVEDILICCVDNLAGFQRPLQPASRRPKYRNVLCTRSEIPSAMCLIRTPKGCWPASNPSTRLHQKKRRSPPWMSSSRAGA